MCKWWVRRTSHDEREPGHGCISSSCEIQDNNSEWSAITISLSFFLFRAAIMIKPNSMFLYGACESSEVIHHCQCRKQTQDSLFLALGKIAKKKNISIKPYVLFKIFASFEFSGAQIVVNDSKLPQGFEISIVWGSFSLSNMSNGFISGGPVTMHASLWANEWIISILNKITANLFHSSVGENMNNAIIVWVNWFSLNMSAKYMLHL